MWWFGLGQYPTPHVLDLHSKSLYAQTGRQPPSSIENSRRRPRNAAVADYVSWLGDQLGRVTESISRAVRGVPDLGATQFSVLLLTPMVTGPGNGLGELLNIPRRHWDADAGVVNEIMIEDYDWVIKNRPRLRTQGWDFVERETGFSTRQMSYLAGFAAEPPTRHIWTNIAKSIQQAEQAGFKNVYIWARPEVFRDGFVWPLD